MKEEGVLVRVELGSSCAFLSVPLGCIQLLQEQLKTIFHLLFSLSRHPEIGSKFFLTLPFLTNGFSCKISANVSSFVPRMVIV